jgi:hypothetical protein
MISPWGVREKGIGFADRPGAIGLIAFGNNYHTTAPYDGTDLVLDKRGKDRRNSARR